MHGIIEQGKLAGLVSDRNSLALLPTDMEQRQRGQQGVHMPNRACAVDHQNVRPNRRFVQHIFGTLMCNRLQLEAKVFPISLHCCNMRKQM